MTLLLAVLLAVAPFQVLGVLEFRDKVPEGQKIDAAYLSDQVRSSAKDALPSIKVITRENMLVLLQSSGKELASCEGECEVDTGRRIGADLVVSGELLRFGTQYKLNMKLHDTRSGELISGSVASGVTADELDHALRPAVEKLLAPLRPEALQEKISDQRQAARQALEKDERRSRYKTIVLSAFATLGYASTSISSSLPASSGSASGFSYDLGGQLFVHLAGPLYAGGFVDFAFFPAVGGGTANGLLAGGGVRFDLGDNTALLAGAGYSDLSKNGGSGYGFLGALEYGIFRLQLAWRHGTSSVVSGLSAVDQTTNVIAVQAGVSISF
jgi:hypothetical protein